MTIDSTVGGGRRANPWRILAWSFAALILLLPAVAMQFTNEVNWDTFDFVFAGVLIGGTGLLFELTVRMSRNHSYRAGVGFALAASFLIVWANGAVGMIGDEDNAYNLLFLGVILLALAGAIVARFRPGGMALAMSVAAAAHAAAAVGGMFTDLRGGIFSTAFAGIWAISALLFAKAARDKAAAARADG